MKKRVMLRFLGHCWEGLDEMVQETAGTKMGDKREWGEAWGGLG